MTTLITCLKNLEMEYFRKAQKIGQSDGEFKKIPKNNSESSKKESESKMNIHEKSNSKAKQKTLKKKEQVKENNPETRIKKRVADINSVSPYQLKQRLKK